MSRSQAVFTHAQALLSAIALSFEADVMPDPEVVKAIDGSEIQSDKVLAAKLVLELVGAAVYLNDGGVVAWGHSEKGGGHNLVSSRGFPGAEAAYLLAAGLLCELTDIREAISEFAKTPEGQDPEGLVVEAGVIASMGGLRTAVAFTRSFAQNMDAARERSEIDRELAQALENWPNAVIKPEVAE
jgi:hypothetical protein